MSTFHISANHAGNPQRIVILITHKSLKPLRQLLLHSLYIYGINIIDSCFSVSILIKLSTHSTRRSSHGLWCFSKVPYTTWEAWHSPPISFHDISQMPPDAGGRKSTAYLFTITNTASSLPSPTFKPPTGSTSSRHWEREWLPAGN